MITKEDLADVARPLLTPGAADIRRMETLRKSSLKLLEFIIEHECPWLHWRAVSIHDADLLANADAAAFGELHLSRVRAAVEAVREKLVEQVPG